MKYFKSAIFSFLLLKSIKHGCKGSSIIRLTVKSFDIDLLFSFKQNPPFLPERNGLNNLLSHCTVDTVEMWCYFVRT